MDKEDFRMNQTIKKKWVKALLSGKYEQGKEELCSWDNRYCCLGVLREVMGSTDKLKHPTLEYLSRAQLDACGLDHNTQASLAAVNDKGVPFDMIAGLIDEAL